MKSVLIIGGGHAAAQLCLGLAEAGQAAHTTLICEEAVLPYQRPPLSKSFLKNADEADTPLRPAAWYAEAGITVHLNDAAVAIDRATRRVTLRSGTTLAYDRLVIATGARARRLPSLAEAIENLAALRHLADARALRPRIAAAVHVTVVGGGFIGLEVAASALAMGKPVTVLESAPRLLARAVSPDLSAHVLATHRAAGMDVRVGVQVGDFEVAENRVQAVHVDGQAEPVDLLVMGIGAVPEMALALEAGLECGNGIVVDAQLTTSDPAILAIGDCAWFHDVRSGRGLRLESVQNANDQARTAVAALTGTPRAHDALPWFWSDQGAALRLQMAGLMPDAQTPGLQQVRRAGPKPEAFSLFHYVDGQLVCVESVNAAMDHLMVRKLMEARRNPSPEAAADAAVPLKAHL